MDEKVRCHICGNIDNRGIILLNKYICGDCELDLAGSSVGGLKYERLKEEIKDIWKDFNEGYEDKSISI